MTATKRSKNSYRFVVTINKKLARLTSEATASLSSRTLKNDSDFSLQNLTYTPLDKRIKTMKSLQISAPNTLTASEASLGNGAGYKPWGDGVKIAGYKADGSKGRTNFGWGGIAVAGNRYDRQIDYDAKSGKSEVLEVDFNGSVRGVNIVLGRMEASEWRNLQETGKWKAYDTKKNVVASGKLDPRSGKKLGDNTYAFKLDSSKDIASLEISATAYGNGKGTGRTDNNSDFNLQSVTYSRVKGVNSPNNPLKSSNSLPDADADSVSTKMNQGMFIDVLSNDSFGADGPSNNPIIIGEASNGSVSLRRQGTFGNPLDDLIRYVPNKGFTGKDQFSYTIADANGDISSATVKVQVTKPLNKPSIVKPPAAKPPVIEPPTIDKKPKVKNGLPKAVKDTAVVDAGKSVNIDVLSNDSFGGDGAGGPITVGSADHGKVSVLTQGTTKIGDDVIRYVADKNFGGTDSFNYTIKDGNGDKSTATVKVNVKAPVVVPKPPVTKSPAPKPSDNVGGQRVNLSAAGKFINSNQSSHLWGGSVRLSAVGLNGAPAKVVYDTQFADKGFGVSSSNDRWDQIDYYAKNGNLRGVSEKLKLEFDTLVDNVKLTVGMMGFNEGKNGNDETGKWTAYDASGKKVGDGLLGPELSTLGKDTKVKNSYGSYPIAINTSKPIAELVIQATGFGHGQGSPIGKSYGENNSDLNVMGVSFDTLPNTQGGF